MLLGEARTLTTQAVLNVGQASYAATPGKVDRAIQFTGNYLVNATRCVVSKDTHTLTPWTPAFSTLTNAVFDGFMPAFMRYARIGGSPSTSSSSSSSSSQSSSSSSSSSADPGPPAVDDSGFKRLRVVDMEWIRRRLDAYPNQTGQPSYIAFEGHRYGFVYPTPDAAYTISVLWHPPFTTIDPGCSPDDLELNIPDRLIRPPFWYGCASALVYGESENLWATTGWKLFLEHIPDVSKMSNIDPLYSLPTSEPLQNGRK